MSRTSTLSRTGTHPLSVAILYFFAWLGLSLSTSIITVCMMRFVIGLATALNNVSALISIGEIASPEIRGRLTGIYQIFLRTGTISGSIIAVLFSSYISYTRSVTALSVLSLLSMYWVAETPCFLITISRSDQAKKYFQEIRVGYTENEINEEFEKFQKYIEDERSSKSQLSWRTFLKTNAIRKPLLIGVALNFLMVLTGGLLFSVFMTYILPSNDYIPKIYYPLITHTLLFLVSFSLPLFIDSFPRRSMFLFGAAAMVVINTTCALANYFLVANEAMSIFEWISTTGNILSGWCTHIILFPINSAIKSELYPQAVKGFGGSLTVISNAISTIILFQTYGVLERYSYLYFMYFIFSIISLLLCLVIYFSLPEGCGVALPDLQMKFKNKDTHGADNSRR